VQLWTERERREHLAGEAELAVIADEPARLLTETDSPRVKAQLGRIEPRAAASGVQELGLETKKVVDRLVFGDRISGVCAGFPEGARSEDEQGSSVRLQGCRQRFGMPPRLA
jgi:hypothetical protein